MRDGRGSGPLESIGLPGVLCRLRSAEKAPDKIRFKTRPDDGTNGQSLLAEWWKAEDEAKKYHSAIESLDKQWEQVQAKYHAFAYPQGSLRPGSGADSGSTPQQRFAEFNAAADALKGSAATSLAAFVYGVYSEIKNQSTGPMTPEQLATMYKIITVGSQLESLAVGVVSGIASARARKAPARTSKDPPSQLRIRSGIKAGSSGTGGGRKPPSSSNASTGKSTTERSAGVPSKGTLQQPHSVPFELESKIQAELASGGGGVGTAEKIIMSRNRAEVENLLNDVRGRIRLMEEPGGPSGSLEAMAALYELEAVLYNAWKKMQP